LEEIAGVELHRESSANRPERSRLRVQTHGRGMALLSAAEPGRLRDLVRDVRQGTFETSPGVAGPDTAPRDSTAEPDTLLFKGDLSYQEVRAGHHVWRQGTGRYDSNEGFTWQDPHDPRPAIRLQAEDIKSIAVEEGHTPVENSSILILETAEGIFRLAGRRIEQWRLLLRGVSNAGGTVAPENGPGG
jgi:hypothetical protein